MLQNLAFNYQATGNFDLADKTVDRGLVVAPDALTFRGLKAKFAIESRGDFGIAEKLQTQVPPGVDPQGVMTFGRVNLFILQRKFPEALALLERWPEELIHGEGTAPTSKSFLEGILFWMMGDKAKGQAALERARPVAEQAVKESPDDASRRIQLAWILIGTNRKEEGLREGRRAMELQPESEDAFEGPMITATVAQMYAWSGEKDEAFKLLEHCLSVPNGVTIALLKIDPIWDPLRADPRFQALINKYGART